MTPDNRHANVAEEMARGHETFRAAEALFKLGLFNDAVSRAYYAAYHWAKALLLTKGMESKTHRGVVQLVGLHFVREGLLPPEAATLLSQLEDAREMGDYTPSAHFTETNAREMIGRAKDFLESCRPVLAAWQD